jgi:tetratricopeptide (TPR) repeat protein
MTDPRRSDQPTEAGVVPERDPEREKDARIESLLLAGLDHYFAAQHELAISVWSRVLFLDRGHARAKAYIDRARSAIAERQREGDELLHTGAAAVDRGDAGAARSLLNSAVERGAATEEALVLLERLNRLEHANAPAPAIASKPLIDTADYPQMPGVDRSSSSRVVWVAMGVVAGLGVAGVVAWIGLTRPEWLPMNPATIRQDTVQAAEPLPVPASAEIWLSRARNYYEQGRLHDALTALQAISPTDPRKANADELKAAIQSRLLEAARKSPAPPQ